MNAKRVILIAVAALVLLVIYSPSVETVRGQFHKPVVQASFLVKDNDTNVEILVVSTNGDIYLAQINLGSPNNLGSANFLGNVFMGASISSGSTESGSLGSVKHLYK